jgi:hypothetical protein
MNAAWAQAKGQLNTFLECWDGDEKNIIFVNTFLDLACQEATFQLAIYFTSRPHKYLLDLDAISLHLSAFELQDLVFILCLFNV